MKKVIDKSGKRFNRLLVLRRAGKNKHNQILWLCICDCGKEKIIVSCSLRENGTKSCGCLQKEIASKFNTGNILSQKTKKRIAKSKIGKHIGKDNPNYNPNLTEKDRMDRRSIPGYNDWRECVYKLDNYTCHSCGQIGGSLNAHHIESYNNNPELRTEVSNGITLCETCHNNFHHQYGYGNNTRSQLIEFLKSEVI